MMISKREPPQAIEESGKKEYARMFGSVLRGMLLIVTVCLFSPNASLSVWASTGRVYFCGSLDDTLFSLLLSSV
jgi:hypothetical protein